MTQMTHPGGRRVTFHGYEAFTDLPLQGKVICAPQPSITILTNRSQNIHGRYAVSSGG